MVYVDYWQNSDTFKKWQCSKIDEVVKKTGEFEKDLLRRGVEGELEWWVFCHVSEGFFKDPLGNIFWLQGRFMLPRSALKALVNGASASVKTFYTDDGTKMNVMHQVGKKEEIKPPAGATFEVFEITEPRLLPAWVEIQRDELYLLPNDLEKFLESNQRENQTVKPLERQELNQGHEKEEERWDLSGWEGIEKYASKVCRKPITRDKLVRALEKHPGKWKRSEGGVKGNGKPVQGHSGKLKRWLSKHKIS